jgi:pseudouridine synthase
MLERANDDSRKQWIVTMSEGRNRQIRRTFGSLGYDVVKLHRTNFGNYSLGDMKPGEYKTVDMR